MKVFFVYCDANSAPPVPCIKDLLNLSQQRYNAANRSDEASVRGTPANYEKPLSVPCHEGVQKAVFTTCLTTDRRGVCGNSGGKSCEERP